MLPPPTILLYMQARGVVIGRAMPTVHLWLRRRLRAEARQAILWIQLWLVAYELWILEPPRLVVIPSAL